MKIVRLEDFKQFSPEKMKKNNLFQTPRFFCDVYAFEPGQAQKGHVHGEQDKIYIVLDGQGTFQVGKGEQVLAPGQGIMASAGEEHGVHHEGQVQAASQAQECPEQKRFARAKSSGRKRAVRGATHPPREPDDDDQSCYFDAAGTT